MSEMIKEYASEIKKTFLEPLTNNIILKERFYDETNRERADGEYQRDYTRILYASSFNSLEAICRWNYIGHKYSLDS